jgi:cobalt-zinc-cadmium efflux system membrane fusion protein
MMACDGADPANANEKTSGSNEPAPALSKAATRKEEIRLSPEAQAEAGIQTIIAHAAAVPETVLANGSLMPNEDRTWTVSSYSLGRVAALEAKVGDSVKAGQVLARMHSHEVHDSRAAYRQAVAALEEAKAQEAFANKAFTRAQRLLRILLVEDETATAEMLAKNLREHTSRISDRNNPT